MKQEKIVIIGSGPAGCTAAIYAARASLHPRLFTGNVPGGLLTTTSMVENFPGFAAGIPGGELILAMLEQAEKFGTAIAYEGVAGVRFSDGGKQRVISESGEEYAADAVIVATGASPRWTGLPGEERLRGHGLSACATCDGAFYKDLPIAVLGGGDTALTEALYLTRFTGEVHLILRSSVLHGSTYLAGQVEADPAINIHRATAVEALLGEKKLTGLHLKPADKPGFDLPVSGCFVALGHLPETGIFKPYLKLDEAGYVRREKCSSATSLAGIFAAGDCADPTYRQAVTAAGMGCQAAMDAIHYLEHHGGES